MSEKESLFPDARQALMAFADDALEVVCDTCGYSPDESDIYQFRKSIYDQEPMFGVEYRFMGALGFGGKFYLHTRSFANHVPNIARGDYRCYVDCYPEDKTPECESMIRVANQRLSALCDEYAEAIIRG